MALGFTSSPTSKNLTIFATQSILQKSSVWPWLWEFCSKAQKDRNRHFLRSWLRILLFYLNLGVTKLLKNQKNRKLSWVSISIYRKKNKILRWIWVRNSTGDLSHEEMDRSPRHVIGCDFLCMSMCMYMIYVYCIYVLHMYYICITYVLYI